MIRNAAALQAQGLPEEALDEIFMLKGRRGSPPREPGIERRRDARVRMDLTLSVLIGKGRRVLAHTVDLCPRGLRFQHVGPGIDRGEALLVQFTLGRETFSFCGLPLRVKVVETFIQEVALSFVGIDPKTRNRLRKSLPG